MPGTNLTREEAQTRAGLLSVESYTVDLDLTVSDKVFDSVLETARFKQRLYTVPIWSNTQLLWYRKDRVPQPPKTWDEMIDMGEKLGPAKGRIQVQANRYEGLVVLVNQLIESAGSSILAGPKQIKLDKAPTERALGILGRLSRSAAAPPNSRPRRGHGPARLRGRRLELMINYS